MVGDGDKDQGTELLAEFSRNALDPAALLAHVTILRARTLVLLTSKFQRSKSALSCRQEKASHGKGIC